MKKIILLGLLAALTCCTSAKEPTSNALDTVGDETSASYNKVRGYFDVNHKPVEKKLTPAPRYCYKTFEDIVCYGAPVEGDDIRLVGYQDANGKTGYVLPEEEHSVPASKLPPLKTITVPATPKVAAVPGPGDPPAKKQLKEVIFDPAELEPKQLVPDKPQ